MPKTLTSGERLMILKVNDYCERENRNNAPILPIRCVQARVAAMTGISEKTVSKITKEGKIAASTSTKLTSPRKSGPRQKRFALDDFEQDALRQRILDYYNEKNEIPTLSKIWHEMRNEKDFKGSRTTLWRIIRDMGMSSNLDLEESPDADGLSDIET